ncbi:MAG: hypothetical protein HWD59_04435 [Coxiellaceae bacterium]|nr:MAG: hypothetical protein HWD59_04435 [Coxiellaceae bacterium]
MPTCYIVYARETGIEPQVKLLANYLLTIGMDVICEAILKPKAIIIKI